MFSSILFRKTFFSIVLIMLPLSIVSYHFSVPFIQSKVYRIEENAANTVLKMIYNFIENGFHNIDKYKKKALETRKHEMQIVVQLIEGILDAKYELWRSGRLSEAAANGCAGHGIVEF